VPPDLRHALTTAAKANAQWADLTPIARRDFMSWIDSAKQAATRTRRIERARSLLAAGKRRPCCYTIVSFDLYSALKDHPPPESEVKADLYHEGPQAHEGRSVFGLRALRDLRGK